MLKDPIVIVSAVRTPIGSFQGQFKTLTAVELGAAAIQGALQRSKVSPEHINEVLMGCVLSAGLGQAPARQAALQAGLPPATPCTTVNKMCGSGMKTVMLAYDSLIARPDQMLIAGGMESMTQAPYLLPKARAGYRMGHQTVIDHMLYDGLEDAYQKGSSMGLFAEECATEYGFTREMQDAYAITSIKRAQAADFTQEIVPVLQITQDEGPTKAQLEKIPLLKPAFKAGGTVTAANASSISDGAAALMLTRLSIAEQHGLQPLAVIKAHSSYAAAPAAFPTAPISAIRQVLAQVAWSVADVDLFEINEAFAVVPMAAMQTLQLPADKVNIHGGACVLGHPIGASGARILVTLVHALHQNQLQRGIAALCIGGGEATAVALERYPL
ncbi:MAG: acetyl-CoA C-acyltransferase [Gammaproteobacteria bacterium]